MKILGEICGVEFVDRGDGHIALQLLSEDDETWHEQGTPFSSFWIDDLIKVLSSAKMLLDDMPKDPSGFGRTFKAEGIPEKYNRQFHRGPYKHLCPICKKISSWFHLPHINGFTFETHESEILDCCWKCFHEIWKGAN